MDSSLNNKRIAKNTLFLYFRMFITMAVSLYTSRVILQILGIEDFGIYNIVGGLVSMFSLMSGALSDSVSRFLTIEIGCNNKEKLNKVFITSINIHIILAIVVFVALETVGMWFLNYKMNINPDKLYAANWVFQFSMLTFVINLLSIPYNAMIIAYEKMNIYSYVSILEVLSKLAICYLLLITENRLILYSILLFIVALLIRVIYGVYCKKEFEAAIYKFYCDKTIIKQMFGFSIWNFFGSMANMFKSQGVSILMNIFYGTFINAAQGIATQASNAVEQFSSNFMKALNPQIIKSYAANDTTNILYLSSMGTRFAFFLLTVISVPIYFNIDYILNLWLTTVPNWTGIFIRLILCNMMIDALSRTLITIIQASGKIAKYQIGVSIIIFLNFPLSYICLKNGFPPYSIYVMQITVGLLCLCWRLYIVSEFIKFSIMKYIANVICKPIVTLCVILCGYKFLHNITQNYSIPFFFEITVGLLLSLFIIYICGISKNEKHAIIKSISKKIRND